MLNVPELERRWKRYRRAKQIPYIIAGIIVSAVGAGAVVYFLIPQATTTAMYQAKTATFTAGTTAKTKKPQTSTQQQTVQTSHSSAPSAPVAPFTAAPKVAQENSKLHPAASSQRPKPTSPKPTVQTVKLTPSMTFMQDFESDVMQYYNEEASSSASSIQYTSPATHAPEKLSGLPAIRSQAVAPLPPHNVEAASAAHPAAPAVLAKGDSKQMVIKREDDMKDIQDVIKRFKKNKNPALSLFVAKRYYRIGNYQQAYNYALMTNELNSNIEDSWLIFAKSLYKLDQKEMAIKTLKTYYDDSGSVKAKITLDQMQKGTLK